MSQVSSNRFSEASRPFAVAVIGIICTAELVRRSIGTDLVLTDLRLALGLAALIVLSVLTIGALTCALHIYLAACPAHGQMEKETHDRLEVIQQKISEARQSANDYRSFMRRHLGWISREGAESLSLMTKFLDALEGRHKDVSALLAMRDELSLIEAHTLSTAPVKVRLDPLGRLIDGDPIPPVPIVDALMALGRIATDLEDEQRALLAEVTPSRHAAG